MSELFYIDPLPFHRAPSSGWNFYLLKVKVIFPPASALTGVSNQDVEHWLTFYLLNISLLALSLWANTDVSIEPPLMPKYSHTEALAWL